MKKLLVILGPTGVGKTKLSIELATQLNCPIISADSRQVYKGMTIGTDAPNTEQLQKVKHHFVGELSVEDYFSASQYEDEVIALLEKLYVKHNIVVMSGGSMLYIDAVCNGIDYVPDIDKSLRKNLMELYELEGIDPIRMQLKLRDPMFYNQVDLKNHKRIIHALEVCIMTGQPYSSYRTNTVKERPFEIIKIGLTRPREELYQRINERVDQMIERGLVEEAKKFHSLKHLNSLNTVGYKELFKYFDGEWTLEFAIDKIKQHSRNYARKQLSWFNRSDDIHWFDLSDESVNVKEKILEELNNK
ncbi:MAG: tRNA (adenosine(37)-N6)-dimethylallyltransferase MiaA [Dysgonamonadaceae bacterium]|nr:tRNA (adenosine(37)-N6)-dimethylallyltransferase MiaA [Dysgonamonadaceae bacterium]MDD4727847.1 tRNA (adenosine(37)-N6)-dimethylallyltransferase MiaA [Dysgonamonadaceae bacterium]